MEQPKETWWLYHKTEKPRHFFDKEAYLAAIETGEWKDTPDAFFGEQQEAITQPSPADESKAYSKTQIGRMRSADRIEILLKQYGVALPADSSRQEEIDAILEQQEIHGKDS